MRRRRSGRERRAEIINKISNSGDSKRGERPLFFLWKKQDVESHPKEKDREESE